MVSGRVFSSGFAHFWLAFWSFRVGFQHFYVLGTLLFPDHRFGRFWPRAIFVTFALLLFLFFVVAFSSFRVGFLHLCVLTGRLLAASTHTLVDTMGVLVSARHVPAEARPNPCAHPLAR